MPSNMGTRHLVSQTRMGFGDIKEARSQREIEEMVLKELRKDFSPEFINRIDDVIVFHPLSHEELSRVCRLLIDDVNATLRYKNVTVTIDDEAIEWLLSKAGEDPHMGARPLRRAIQKYVEDRISESLIVDRDEKIEGFTVTVTDGELDVSARDKEIVVQEN